MYIVDNWVAKRLLALDECHDCKGTWGHLYYCHRSSHKSSLKMLVSTAFGNSFGSVPMLGNRQRSQDLKAPRVYLVGKRTGENSTKHEHLNANNLLLWKGWEKEGSHVTIVHDELAFTVQDPLPRYLPHLVAITGDLFKLVHFRTTLPSRLVSVGYWTTYGQRKRVVRIPHDCFLLVFVMGSEKDCLMYQDIVLGSCNSEICDSSNVTENVFHRYS